MSATVRLIGADTLLAQLKLFPKAVQERAVKKGVSKGAAMLRTALRRAAYAGPMKGDHESTGNLRRSLTAVVGKRAGKIGKAWVGLKRIKGAVVKASDGKAQRATSKRTGRRYTVRKKGMTLNYYRTLEFGRKASVRNGHAIAGSPPMRPFFRNTWTAQRAAVAQAIVDGTRVALAYEAGRVYAKTRAARR